MKCVKCKGEMEEGIVTDRHSGTPPYLSEMWGTGFKFFRGLQNKHEVKVYRCKDCGYLESYAK